MEFPYSIGDLVSQATWTDKILKFRIAEQYEKSTHLRTCHFDQTRRREREGRPAFCDRAGARTRRAQCFSLARPHPGQPGAGAPLRPAQVNHFTTDLHVDQTGLPRTCAGRQRQSGLPAGQCGAGAGQRHAGPHGHAPAGAADDAGAGRQFAGHGLAGHTRPPEHDLCRELPQRIGPHAEPGRRLTHSAGQHGWGVPTWPAAATASAAR